MAEKNVVSRTRIIWELAVAFSPRCKSSNKQSTLQSEGNIYSEIIRVWDIVLNHDKISSSVERIEKSHKRGEMCSLQKNLRPSIHDRNTKTMDKRFPMLYSDETVSREELQQKQKELQKLFPPASANETEYHILKFYSFSPIARHVLQNIETEVEFPFRVTELEHSIIDLGSESPILLIGRSGTGKTTCCVYRLWSEYSKYWSTAEANEPILPGNRVETQQAGADDSEVEKETTEEVETERRDDEVLTAEDDTEAQKSEISQENIACSQKAYDHLHQVFITKNGKLCSQVKKNFHGLRQGNELLREKIVYEGSHLPNKLQDLRDHSFPLFVTSKNMLLLLDASLPPPFFFDRSEDGRLKVTVDDSGELEEDEVKDEWDSEDESETEETITDELLTQANQLVYPRKMVTYEYFLEKLWPKINKKTDRNKKYHPSIVWMEIVSFIKGSYEALTTPTGVLDLGDYLQIGRKRAPNFTGERDVIYDMYIKYEHEKKQRDMFDEADLVRNLFKRLCSVDVTDRCWVIHQMYVDETQDFTQAELFLLIHLCSDPNQMFLTGDTAQSIMRGISFRFSDLHSLFHHLQRKTQRENRLFKVVVPKKVHQLVHNYRSHSGILSLSSSVLELMLELFPESFDRLQPDQGLFPGPQPILMESCRFSDLIVLLQGNKRESSHIEFGAHQAILGE